VVTSVLLSVAVSGKTAPDEKTHRLADESAREREFHLARAYRREEIQMPDATIRRLDQMETFYDGMVTRARAELGVTSWGMQVFALPPKFDQYPNHHHGEGAGDPGQEEVYIPLAGSAKLLLDGEERVLAPGVWARIGIDQHRQLIPGEDGFRYIALGGTPGRAFVPPEWTELGPSPPVPPE
jgi:hypothetical protein